MFATTAGFMIGLGVLLFVVRSRRPKEEKKVMSTSTGSGREDDRGRKVKYDSDGRPL
ncbi:MAG TPA: hypothetical protein VFH25_03970 [Nitrososphaeraceae archaeon]|nr:hypothetical protein [Nitrososphaeraceae archaeon]HET9357798.1 hypothetical protein [Nitrososphaeraceae archaeon]